MHFKNSSDFTSHIQVALAMRLVGSNNSLSSNHDTPIS
ncbi:hypothetical protein XBKQ1_2100076 [Xenorhabdus bovienii str. kraussei Quebec]|uniref:Uncharacterized protein n=1 Tax=Xenorhabdus bovienii str. kraussei Quebec TaxID=1398203 RepID=A0A077P4H2_XENBV|nr:hypothetical protein XBKQ1_2100076 [Xenorhabdus bovienii str. kraussei Quebec]